MQVFSVTDVSTLNNKLVIQNSTLVKMLRADQQGN